MYTPVFQRVTRSLDEFGLLTASPAGTSVAHSGAASSAVCTSDRDGPGTSVISTPANSLEVIEVQLRCEFSCSIFVISFNLSIVRPYLNSFYPFFDICVWMTAQYDRRADEDNFITFYEDAHAEFAKPGKLRQFKVRSFDQRFVCRH